MNSSSPQQSSRIFVDAFKRNSFLKRFSTTISNNRKSFRERASLREQSFVHQLFPRHPVDTRVVFILNLASLATPFSRDRLLYSASFFRHLLSLDLSPTMLSSSAIQRSSSSLSLSLTHSFTHSLTLSSVSLLKAGRRSLSPRLILMVRPGNRKFSYYRGRCRSGSADPTAQPFLPPPSPPHPHGSRGKYGDR